MSTSSRDASRQHQTDALAIARILGTYLASDTARELAGRTLPPVVEFFSQEPGDWAVIGDAVRVNVRVRNADYTYLELPGEAGRRELPRSGGELVYTASQSGQTRVTAMNALNHSTPVQHELTLRVAPIPDIKLYTPEVDSIQVHGLDRSQVASLAAALSGASEIAIEIDGAPRAAGTPSAEPAAAHAQGEATASLRDLAETLSSLQAQGPDLVAAAIALGPPPASLGAALRSISVRDLLDQSREAQR